MALVAKPFSNWRNNYVENVSTLLFSCWLTMPTTKPRNHIRPVRCQLPRKMSFHYTTMGRRDYVGICDTHTHSEQQVQDDTGSLVLISSKQKANASDDLFVYENSIRRNVGGHIPTLTQFLIRIWEIDERLATRIGSRFDANKTMMQKSIARHSIKLMCHRFIRSQWIRKINFICVIRRSSLNILSHRWAPHSVNAKYNLREFRYYNHKFPFQFNADASRLASAHEMTNERSNKHVFNAEMYTDNIFVATFSGFIWNCHRHRVSVVAIVTAAAATEPLVVIVFFVHLVEA